MSDYDPEPQGAYAMSGPSRDPDMTRITKWKLLPDELCDALVEYLERENESLAEVHSVRPDGPIDDPEVAAEVERVAGWIEQIRGALTSTVPFSTNGD